MGSANGVYSMIRSKSKIHPLGTRSSHASIILTSELILLWTIGRLLCPRSGMWAVSTD
jgi:hypothetical protein